MKGVVRRGLLWRKLRLKMPIETSDNTLVWDKSRPPAVAAGVFSRLLLSTTST
jgi:hypothetical protein